MFLVYPRGRKQAIGGGPAPQGGQCNFLSPDKTWRCTALPKVINNKAKGIHVHYAHCDKDTKIAEWTTDDVLAGSAIGWRDPDCKEIGVEPMQVNFLIDPHANANKLVAWKGPEYGSEITEWDLLEDEPVVKPGDKPLPSWQEIL